MILLPFVVN